MINTRLPIYDYLTKFLNEKFEGDIPDRYKDLAREFFTEEWEDIDDPVFCELQAFWKSSKNTIGVYRFCFGFRYTRDYEGLYLGSRKTIQKIINRELNFGDICGKYSDVSLVINDSEFVLITEDEKEIEMFKKYAIFDGIMDGTIQDFLDQEDSESDDENSKI